MDIYQELSKVCQVDQGVSIKKLTTLKIGGTSKYVVYPSNLLELDLVIRILNDNCIKYRLFGKGSNILASDDYYDGCIIKLDRNLNKYYLVDNSLFVYAGCSLMKLSLDMAYLSKSNLEFVSGIPGTIGGAIVMNAGAYNQSMSDIVEEVLVYSDKKYFWLSKDELNFSYRHSIFQDCNKYIVIGAKINLIEKDSKNILTLMDERKTRRVNSQPLNFPSCGSVFRNPKDKHVWEYIDSVGCRSLTIGDAQVSQKHANFIINNGNASANDYLQVINEIMSRVKNEFDVDLILEVEKFNWK